MSPTLTAAFPFLVDLCGGQQSARTIHFFATLSLTLFVAVHLLLVIVAGFRARVRTMVTGRAEAPKERP